MDAMLVVDMQVGLLYGEPKYDLRGVVERINWLAAKVREGTLNASGASDLEICARRNP